MKITAARSPGLLLAILTVLTVPTWSGAALSAAGEPSGKAPAPVEYALGRELCRLADPAVRESSGLAASRRNPGVFWTHNDSGGEPCLYAFDARGRNLGAHPVTAGALDWEDLAAVTVGGRHYLVVADTGDNFRLRGSATLYWMEEPEVPAAPAGGRRPAAPEAVRARALRFTFEGGTVDCESAAVDPADGTVFLVSQPGRGARNSTVYSLPGPFPRPGAEEAEPAAPEPPVARRFAQIPVPAPRAMDISPDGRRALLVNLQAGFEFQRRAGETWKQAFARPPRQIALPKRPQGEGACYGHDGVTIYLTSETRKPGELCPFYVVPPAEKRPD